MAMILKSLTQPPTLYSSTFSNKSAFYKVSFIFISGAMTINVRQTLYCLMDNLDFRNLTSFRFL